MGSVEKRQQRAGQADGLTDESGRQVQHHIKRLALAARPWRLADIVSINNIM